VSIERRTRANGRSCWNVRWHEGGKNRGRLFDTRKDALAWNAEVRRRRRLGELGMLDYGKRTLAELHEAWWEVHSPDLARATREAYEGAWQKLIEPRLGKLRLAEITPLALEQFMRSLLAAGVGEASAEKAWVVLSSMLGRAEAWGWVSRSPVRAARKPRKQNARRVPRPLMPPRSRRFGCSSDNPMPRSSACSPTPA
jgi:Phage integrase, N-terminal SAM-like domain